MTLADAKSIYLKSDEMTQAKILCHYTHELTIAARGTYVPMSEDVADARQLRRINEIIHKAVSQISALLASDDKRYPDETILKILIPENCTVFPKIVSRVIPEA